MKLRVKKTAVYLDEELYRALLVKSRQTKSPVSALVNESVRHSFAEDAADRKALCKCKNEPCVSFEKVLKKLKTNGKI